MYIIRELEAYFDRILTKIANFTCFEYNFTTNVVKKRLFFNPMTLGAKKIDHWRPKRCNVFILPVYLLRAPS